MKRDYPMRIRVLIKTGQIFKIAYASFLLSALLNVSIIAAEIVPGHKDFKPSPTRPMSWRGDGTGAWPAATPVTSCDGTDHLIWKTPLPSFGHSSPVLVRDRVFLLCDEGYKSDAPTLVCVDANHGKILWEQPVDNLDAMSPEQAAPWRKKRAAVLASIKALKIKSCKGPESRKNNPAYGVWFGKYQAIVKSPEMVELLKENIYHKAHWDGKFTGNTFASPISDGTFVYVSTAQNTYACFDLDGKRQWLTVVKPPEKRPDDPGYSYIPSPVLGGGKLISSAGWMLRAFDASTGKLSWELPLSKTSEPEGTGATPAILRVDDQWVVALQDRIWRVEDGKLLAELRDPTAPGKANLRAGTASTVAVNDVIYILDSAGGAGSLSHKSSLIAFRLAFQAGELKATHLWTLFPLGKGRQEHMYTPVATSERIYLQTGIVDAKSGQFVKEGPVGQLYSSPILAGGIFISRDVHSGGGPRYQPNAKLSYRVTDIDSWQKIGEITVIGAPYEFADLVEKPVVIDQPKVGAKDQQTTPIDKELDELLGGDSSAKPAEIEIPMPPPGSEEEWARFCMWHGQWGFSNPAASADRLYLRSNLYLYCIGHKPKSEGSNGE